jgi:hypothetical protein
MRRIRFRVVLPIIFGFLTIAFFTWDYENERVVASMGMGWDTGPPMWPYVVVPLFTHAVNAPAYVVVWPILRLFALWSPLWEYPIALPLIVGLWWWVGRCIDFGLLGCRNYKHQKSTFAFLIAGAIALLILAAQACVAEYHSFQLYWPGHPPIYAALLLRAAGPAFWCVFVARAFVRAAIALRQPNSGKS